MNTNRLLAALLVAAPLLMLSTPTRAAPSYDACTNFIPSLPATISTQGVWCLNKDLATAISSGNAITINTNNVTIDCNGYKLGGLGAGPGTNTIGIYANGRANVTVRDCNIRGFVGGVTLEGSSGSGHRIERNRFEGNTGGAIGVAGDGSLVRDNLVVDTGGSTMPIFTWIAGITVSGRVDVIDNQIVSVDGNGSASGQAIGIVVGTPSGSTILRNRISAIVHAEGAQSIGIAVMGDGVLDVRDNSLASDSFESTSVACTSELQILHGNALLMGFLSGSCYDGGDNYGFPVGPVGPL